jgi:NitT/TauT family transport system ATP-binding protein
MSDPFVQFDRVRLAYDATGNAIEDVSVSIGKGEFVAIVGPSGCGKSTFMKLCAGLHPPSEGAVAIGGNRVTGALKFVGMAFQNANLLPWRTTLDNVLLPLEIVEPHRSNFRREKPRFKALAESLLAMVGLAGQGGKFPWELSGGMQQRASICRALVHDPALLLLDEPFGALDAFTREELWCVLRDVWALKRFTVVLVTHDLREAAFLADTIFVMSQRPGKIVLRKEVDLPRPRELEISYTDRFNAIVHELRARIGIIRKA